MSVINQFFAFFSREVGSTTTFKAGNTEEWHLRQKVTKSGI